MCVEAVHTWILHNVDPQNGASFHGDPQICLELSVKVNELQLW